MSTTDAAGARYSWGGDEHLFVEMAEEMSLEAYFRSMAVVGALRERRPDGVLEICPANASYQVRFDPDTLAPDDLEALAREIEEEVGDAHDFALRHADHRDPGPLPRSVDARDADALPRAPPGPEVHRHRVRGADQRLRDESRTSSTRTPARPGSSRWSASWRGCRSSTRWSSRERQIEVPKYLRPRTDTPKLTVGHGGCFGCIYSVRGAGGYQMFGITPMPIYDPHAGAADFKRLHAASSSRATS